MKSIKLRISIKPDRATPNTKIVLFGMSRFILENFYGSARNVEIHPSTSTLSYVESLQKTATHPFICKGMRLKTAYTPFFDKPFQVNKINAISGQQYTQYIDPMLYYGVLQFNNRVVDIPIEFPITPNVYLEWDLGMITSHVEIFATFYYEHTVSLSDLLSVKEIVHTIH